MLNWWTELHVFDRRSVTEYHYCKEIILPHVWLFQDAIGPDVLFKEDISRPQRTADNPHLLESEDITRMDWTVFSFDLNPLEHMWDALGERLVARLHPP
ncbi:transposable element Tc3 transposase [Trichonephila clavipes]|nr:transposable element Tc3 transposase [Trichonephila clavipes]